MLLPTNRRPREKQQDVGLLKGSTWSQCDAMRMRTMNAVRTRAGKRNKRIAALYASTASSSRPGSLRPYQSPTCTAVRTPPLGCSSVRSALKTSTCGPSVRVKLTMEMSVERCSVLPSVGCGAIATRCDQLGTPDQQHITKTRQAQHSCIIDAPLHFLQGLPAGVAPPFKPINSSTDPGGQGCVRLPDAAAA